MSSENNKASLIKEAYISILREKGTLPTYSDFDSSITKDAIRHHHGGIEKLHKLIASENAEEVAGAATPVKDLFAKAKGASDADKKRFIITTAVGGAKAHSGFLAAIDVWCNRNDADVIIMPCEDVTNSFENETAWFDPVFQDPRYLFVTQNTMLNDNLTLCSIQVSAKQIKPTAGIARIGNRSGSYVFASPKQFLDYVPCGNSRTENYSIMTPGACTVSSYFSNRYVSKRLSYIADHDHTIGAIVVEIDDEKYFHFRQVQAAEDGSFVDLGIEYRTDGSTKSDIPCVVVYGDIHHAQMNHRAFETFEEEISDHLNTQGRFLHDLFDGISVNHHIDTIGGRYLNQKNSSLQKELVDVYDFLSELADKDDVFVVQSNHNEFLDRYLKEGRYVHDPQNHYAALKIAALMFENDGEPLLKHALEWAVESECKSNIRFLTRDDSFRYGGVELAAHGDLGLNGAKASLASLEQIYGKCVVGHAHSAAILRTGFRVGVMTNLDMGYNRGPSSWTTTNAIVYENGQIQLINMINGHFKGSAE